MLPTERHPFVGLIIIMIQRNVVWTEMMSGVVERTRREQQRTAEACAGLPLGQAGRETDGWMEKYGD